MGLIQSLRRERSFHQHVSWSVVVSLPIMFRFCVIILLAHAVLEAAELASAVGMAAVDAATTNSNPVVHNVSKVRGCMLFTGKNRDSGDTDALR